MPSSSAIPISGKDLTYGRSLCDALTIQRRPFHLIDHGLEPLGQHNGPPL